MTLIKGVHNPFSWRSSSVNSMIESGEKEKKKPLKRPQIGGQDNWQGDNCPLMSSTNHHLSTSGDYTMNSSCSCGWVLLYILILVLYVVLQVRTLPIDAISLEGPIKWQLFIWCIRAWRSHFTLRKAQYPSNVIFYVIHRTMLGKQ